MVQNEFHFTLPRGYVDAEGTVHKNGRMRLATAADEILPLSDVRALQNPSYVTILILSRVITKLGPYDNVNTAMIEQLFTADYNYLQELYKQINNGPDNFLVCPNCGHPISLTSDSND